MVESTRGFDANRRKVLEHAEKVRNHTILEDSSNFNNRNSRIAFKCNKCGKEHFDVLIQGYLRIQTDGCQNCNTGRGRTRAHAMTPEQRLVRKQVFPVTSEQVEANLLRGRIKELELLKKKCADFNHEIVDFLGGQYINKDSIGLFYCKTHQIFEYKRVHNYKRANCGLFCCSKDAKGKTNLVSQVFLPAISGTPYSFQKENSDRHHQLLMGTPLMFRCQVHTNVLVRQTPQEFLTRGMPCCRCKVQARDSSVSS